MRYRCPQCGYIFEGELANCPNCHVNFSFEPIRERINYLESLKAKETSNTSQYVMNKMLIKKQHIYALILSIFVLISSIYSLFGNMFGSTGTTMDGKVYTYANNMTSILTNLLVDMTQLIKYTLVGQIYRFVCFIFALVIVLLSLFGIVISIINIVKDIKHIVLKDDTCYNYCKRIYDNKKIKSGNSLLFIIPVLNIVLIYSMFLYSKTTYFKYAKNTKDLVLCFSQIYSLQFIFYIFFILVCLVYGILGIIERRKIVKEIRSK